jgi:uncharacterized membrane protein YeaQ/YmgE (transglycosylase-associated protein family)
MSMPLIGHDVQTLFTIQEGLGRALLLMLCTGIVFGALMRLLFFTKETGGLVTDLALGVAGAVTAGMLGRAIPGFPVGDGAAMAVAGAGALGTLWMYRQVARWRFTAVR